MANEQESELFHFDVSWGSAMNVNGVAQWFAETGKFDLHYVASLEGDASAEAEDVCAEEVDVGIAGTTVSSIFKMMMFQIFESVGHVSLAGEELVGPDDFAIAFDGDTAAIVFEVGVDDEFRAEGAGAELGVGQVEIVFLFQHVVGEFVGKNEADTARFAGRIDDVSTRDFRFIATVVAETGDFEWLIVGAENGAAAFIKPFR